MNLKVSILIPVFNRDSIIQQTIKSALEQTYKNIEVIVVDNASTDNTWQIIQSIAIQDSRVKAFRNDTNLGPVRNWLRCVEEASGEYGKILWSDDLIASDFIEKTLPLLKDDNVGFVFTGTKIFSGEKPKNEKVCYSLGKTGLYPSSHYIENVIYEGNMPVSPGCAIFRMEDIRKNLWLDVPNQINSEFSMHAIGNDVLLFLLTAKDYEFFGNIAEPLSFFRAHEGSISVSSKSGKLPLHYALAKSYFIENYLLSEAACYASKIKVMLWRYKDAGNFGMRSVNDFFVKPPRLSKFCLIKYIFTSFLRIPKYLIKKAFDKR